jgi:DNA-binding IclR family transcriptional regulator
MTRNELPDELRRFVLTSIPSVPYLEAILLLRADAGRAWDPSAVAGRLYTPEAKAIELLQAMQQAGVCTRSEDGRFTYEPVTPELARMLDAMAMAYARDLVGVTDLIHSGMEKRAQQFADAFRWNNRGRR